MKNLEFIKANLHKNDANSNKCILQKWFKQPEQQFHKIFKNDNNKKKKKKLAKIDFLGYMAKINKFILISFLILYFYFDLQTK